MLSFCIYNRNIAGGDCNIGSHFFNFTIAYFDRPVFDYFSIARMDGCIFYKCQALILPGRVNCFLSQKSYSSYQ